MPGETIPERSLSALHFQLCARVELRDLDSTNGLWFADRRITATELEAVTSSARALAAS